MYTFVYKVYSIENDVAIVRSTDVCLSHTDVLFRSSPKVNILFSMTSFVKLYCSDLSLFSLVRLTLIPGQYYDQQSQGNFCEFF